MSNVSPEEYRRVMSHFLTGVTVVIAIEKGRLKGFTANAFSAVSMDPPLVLVCASQQSTTLNCLRSAGRFSVNLLAQDQEDVARSFASKDENKARGQRWRTGERGCPTLDGAMGIIECRLFREYDGGDHVIVLGAVEAITLRPDREPLVYFRGDLFGLRHLAHATAGKSPTCREASPLLSR